MEESLKLILITNGAILLVPGLNFMLISRFAMMGGMFKALQCALGVSFAITIHVIAAVMGVQQIMNSYPQFFRGIQMIGGIIICYIAVQILRCVLLQKTLKSGDNKENNVTLSAFKQGFLVDIFNPLIMCFYVGLFTQIVSDKTTLPEIYFYISVIFFITVFWFSIIAVIFSRQTIALLSKKYYNYVQVVSSLVLFYFGLTMMFNI